MTVGSMCGLLSLIFFLLAALFGVLKEKAAILLAGFNTMPKEQRKLYDRAKMSKDHKNAFFVWAVILGSGAVLSYCIMQYIGIAAIIVWIIVFLKSVHLDEDKAFGKYKIKE